MDFKTAQGWAGKLPFFAEAFVCRKKCTHTHKVYLVQSGACNFLHTDWYSVFRNLQTLIKHVKFLKSTCSIIRVVYFRKSFPPKSRKARNLIDNFYCSNSTTYTHAIEISRLLGILNITQLQQQVGKRSSSDVLEAQTWKGAHTQTPSR